MDNQPENEHPSQSLNNQAVDVPLNEHGLPAVREDKTESLPNAGVPAPLRLILGIVYVISVLVILFLMFGAIFGLLAPDSLDITRSLANFGIVAIIVLANTFLRRFVQRKYTRNIPESEQAKHGMDTKLSALRSGRVAWTIVLCLWLLSNISASLQSAANPSSVGGIVPLITFPVAVVSIVGVIVTSVRISKAKKRLLN